VCVCEASLEGERGKEISFIITSLLIMREEKFGYHYQLVNARAQETRLSLSLQLQTTTTRKTPNWLLFKKESLREFWCVRRRPAISEKR